MAAFKLVYFPAVQSVQIVAADILEYLPDRQFEHEALPDALLYVPAGQL